MILHHGLMWNSEKRGLTRENNWLRMVPEPVRAQIERGSRKGIGHEKDIISIDMLAALIDSLWK